MADDLMAFAVIATAYRRGMKITPLLIGVGVLALILLARSFPLRRGSPLRSSRRARRRGR
jgi:Na+/H+ antiporter NhaA